MAAVPSIGEGLAALGLDPTADQLAQVDLYLAEIELWNPRAGLVNAAGAELIVRHLFDSLAGLPYIEALAHDSIADVGSGAGFPGIPLAIFLPDAAVTLIERSAKRAAFLRNVIALAGLSDRVSVCERGIEAVTERYSLVTLRAFRKFDEFLPLLRAIARPGGAIVAYKGKRSVSEREVAAAGCAGASEIIPLKVPGLDEERTLVVVRADAISRSS